jgi:hypothetical protein
MDHSESILTFEPLLGREADPAIELEARVSLPPSKKSRRIVHLQVKASQASQGVSGASAESQRGLGSHALTPLNETKYMTHVTKKPILKLHKDPQPPLSYPGATPDSDRAKKPPLAEPSASDQELSPGDRVEGLGAAVVRRSSSSPENRQHPAKENGMSKTWEHCFCARCVAFRADW